MNKSEKKELRSIIQFMRMSDDIAKIRSLGYSESIGDGDIVNYPYAYGCLKADMTNISRLLEILVEKEEDSRGE